MYVIQVSLNKHYELSLFDQTIFSLKVHAVLSFILPLYVLKPGVGVGCLVVIEEILELLHIGQCLGILVVNTFLLDVLNPHFLHTILRIMVVMYRK